MGDYMKTAKKEFENLVYQSMKSMGLDDLSSKIIGILYSEPKLMTLQELSKKTNYSFSAVSAAMKILASMHIVETTKKGGSKKLYFSVQRDMMKMTLSQIKTKNDLMVIPAIKNIPPMIERCKKSKEEESVEVQKILEQYYQQMIAVGKIMKNLVEYTKKVQKEVNKK